METDSPNLLRFEKKVTLRKFDKYITEVQMHADEVHGEEKGGMM